MEDSGWTNLTGQIKFRKKNGTVTIIADCAGQVTIPKFSETSTIAGTLPDGYRPSEKIIGIGTPRNSLGYAIQVDVSTQGVLMLTNLNPQYGASYWGFVVSYPVD